MDMKSLPKLGQETRKKRGRWSTRIPTDEQGKPIYGRSLASDTKIAQGKVAGLNSRWIQARNAHEARQIARYTQKSNVQSARANLEEQRARIRKARRSGRGHSELKRPFQGKIKMIR